MLEDRPSGFREIEHTADWELEVWAPDLPGLLAQAGLGMLALMGARLKPQPRVSRQLEMTGQDAEHLLVCFLQELLYLSEMERLAFDHYDVSVENLHLTATFDGTELAGQDRQIKAVTYHNIAIMEDEFGLHVKIVFDV
jgi:SHS2 domain-containing protein